MICYRCLASDMIRLMPGLTVGWWRAWRDAGRLYHGRNRLWLASLYWRCWYWPGYIHPHGWGLECAHGVKPGRTA